MNRYIEVIVTQSIYKRVDYTSIVDILTGEDPAIIKAAREGNSWLDIVAANYGKKSLQYHSKTGTLSASDGIPLRGFNCGEKVYIIDADKKELIRLQQYRRLMVELDKISGHPPRYYYEGTSDDILKEFLEAKYQIVNSAK